MRLAVLQSNYIPWKGYFDLMAMADLFIVYDSVQYTKNDWRNRNLLPTATGQTWLTIPVATAGRSDQRIHEAVIGDRRWARKHWQTVSQLLAGRASFPEYRDLWQTWWKEAESFELLHDVNVYFLRNLAGQLNISTPIVDDRQYQLVDDTPTGKLVQLCLAAGADRYVTGPAGLNYLALDRFAVAGIAVDVIEYDGYPTYQQTTGEFRHGVSVIDVLSSVGSSARGHLRGRFYTVATEVSGK
jgi:hypothetical protein